MNPGLLDGDIGLFRRSVCAAERGDERHDNHHHFVCRACGSIRDVECAVGAAPCMEPRLPEEYDTQEAAVTFWGLCPGCRAAGPVS